MVIAPLGLSSRSGTLRLHREPSHWGGASVDAIVLPISIMVRREIFDVAVTTIDEYLAQASRVAPGAIHQMRRRVPRRRGDRRRRADFAGGSPRVTALNGRITKSDRRRRLCRSDATARLFDFPIRMRSIEGRAIAPSAIPTNSWELGGNYVLVPRERRHVSRRLSVELSLAGARLPAAPP